MGSTALSAHELTPQFFKSFHFSISSPCFFSRNTSCHDQHSCCNMSSVCILTEHPHGSLPNIRAGLFLTPLGPQLKSALWPRPKVASHLESRHQKGAARGTCRKHPPEVLLLLRYPWPGSESKATHQHTLRTQLTA